ncbi:unnamed protein product [Caenorhabditis angaria]|uniref:Mediator of RNA polymerase II transcription subunit 23 n=1 Tax=Caenorhabditis angaria TaxID=860376 RepID=A0A9P1MS94_9PELO|nr:unnamed protein product [Caenorhabditis angaria]
MGENEERSEYDNTLSPQFLHEVKRMRKRLVDHIEDNRLRRTFVALSSDIMSPDPLLCAFFVVLIQKMEQKEKHNLIMEIIKTVHECTEHHAADNIHISNVYETTVDSLFVHALHENVITTTQCIEGLVMTTDFTMRSRIDQRKWKYIQKSIVKIDYKGNRNVLRFLLESQLQRLPSFLTSEQVNELRIVEDVLLQIIDRDANLLPPLMTLSEIMRGMSNQAHMMPRLSAKLALVAIHFRPIADLTHVCGRSYIYPIPQHPGFVPSQSFWETESSVQTPFVQSHHMLPYRPEHTSTFLYTLYMILRQPRGKDSFNPASRKLKTKSHWDGLLSVMICEAMAEAESLSENEPIPRYQWDNIVNIVHYGIFQQLLNPSNFFSVLRGLVKSTHYTRARDEVMWIVFQIVGTFSSNAAFDEAIPEIVELYKVLFSGDVVWMGASDHPAVFARFLAAPSTWMMLEGKDKLPPPSETIQSHIRFITDGAENFDQQNTAMLAALANAYRSDSKVGKMIPPVYAQLLEGSDDSSLFTLSYGRQAINKMTAFSVEYLDALTIRAKKALLLQCFNCLRTTISDKLPSPAVFDTVARICLSIDHEGAAKDVVHISHRSLLAVTSAQTEARDQCFYLFDFLCYRLPTISISLRHVFVTNIISALNGPYIDNAPNHQLYELLEQYLMRQWCWTNFHENIVNATTTFGPSKTGLPPNATAKLLQFPNDFIHASTGDRKKFPICPEIFRMKVITLMRAIKITGQELTLESSMFPYLITGFPWPEKMTKYFPKWALDLIANNNTDAMQPNFAEIQEVVRTNLTLHASMTPQQFIQSFEHSSSNPISTHTVLAVIYKYLHENLDANLALTPEFYEVVGKKTAQEMVIATNFLVDFLISEAQNEIGNNQLFNNMANILSKMVFQWYLLRADRLLISLVMHPTCDETSHISILIVHEFCTMPEFACRLKWFNDNVPKKEHNHTEYIRKIVEYHHLYPEHEIIEMIRGPQHEPLSNVHMPTYYGCLIERLLPVADFIISVTLEQQIFQSFNHLPILTNLCLLYKYHPTPIQFIYSTLFTMFGLVKKPLARTLVTTLAAQIEDVNLTQNFEKYNHQHGTQEQILLELVDRISASLDFILTPPPFVCKDWKTAEFSPGAQTLYLSCIEIMASPHSHETIVPALINVLHIKPHSRPYNVVNLIALMLTALPDDFSQVLHQEFFEVLKSETTKEMTFEELVFDNFEQSQLLHITNRALTINVISQAYWSHCNVCLLNSFAQSHVPKIMELVKTENDFWYALRLIVPIIRRFLEWQSQSDSFKHLRNNPEKFGPLFILRLIFEKLGSLAENGVEFVYEHHLCDLFYNCRYVFAGDFLRDTAIEQFAKLSPRMQDRLKFYVSHSEPSTSSAKEAKETVKEPLTATNSNANANEQEAPQVQHQQVHHAQHQEVMMEHDQNMHQHQHQIQIHQQHMPHMNMNSMEMHHHQIQMHLQHPAMPPYGMPHGMPHHPSQAGMHMNPMMTAQQAGMMQQHHPYMMQQHPHLMTPHYPPQNPMQQQQQQHPQMH